MARNHRGFVEALIAANRIGADVLLLNTSFAGPALAEVVNREGALASLAVIYDEEFTDDRRPRAGRQTRRDADRRLDRRSRSDEPTVEKLIAEPTEGGQPRRARSEQESKGHPADLGHHRNNPRAPATPAGRTRHLEGHPRPHAVACRGGHRHRRTDVPRVGFRPACVRGIDGVHHSHPAESSTPRPPWRWSTSITPPDCVSSQSCSTASWTCPMRCAARYSGRSLRLSAASGSRMRPDVVVKFMDRFGDVIYNNYNATEAGMIATATARRPTRCAGYRWQAGRWHRDPNPGPRPP